MLLSVQAHQSRETSSVHPSVETGWLQWSYNQNIQNNTLDVKKKKTKQECVTSREKSVSKSVIIAV